MSDDILESEVEINPENSDLLIEITDALSERDRVTFTIRTKTNMKEFRAPEVIVTRTHEDFIWLHDQMEDELTFAGLIIPPCPPKPDFDASREKLVRLTDADGRITEVELKKIKADIEAEFLTLFKKTVAMHGVFLERIANHPKFRLDSNFRIFLEYENALGVRLKGRRERLSGYVQRSVTDQVSIIVSNVAELDEDQELKQRRSYLMQYHNILKEALFQSDKMTRGRRAVGYRLILVHSAFQGIIENCRESPFHKHCLLWKSSLENLRKLEMRSAGDEDLKLTDTFRYYRDDTEAAVALLNRRLRVFQEYAVLIKSVEKARTRQKDVKELEDQQDAAFQRFQQLSESCRTELHDFKNRRITYIMEHLHELAKCEIKNAQDQLEIMKETLETLKTL